MTQHDDDRLATWLAEGRRTAPTASLERALRAARATRQRPAWLVAATGGTISAERTNRSVGLAWGLVAVVALIGLLIGGLVVGGWLRPQPAPDAVLPSTNAIPIADRRSVVAARGRGPDRVHGDRGARARGRLHRQLRVGELLPPAAMGFERRRIRCP